VGKLDPLIIFTTPYSDTPRASHTNSNLAAPARDKLLAIELDASLANLSGEWLKVDTKAMNIPFSSQQLDGSGMLLVAEPSGSTYSERTLMLINATKFLQEVDFTTSDPTHLRITPAQCELGTGESTFVFLHCYTPKSYYYSGLLNIFERRLQSKRVNIAVSIDNRTGVSGDADEDGELTLNDLILMIRILYRDTPMLAPRRLIDSNCDGVFDLVDLVIYIDVLYQQTDLPCSLSKQN
jgi:hypothetical protein